MSNVGNIFAVNCAGRELHETEQLHKEQI